MKSKLNSTNRIIYIISYDRYFNKTDWTNENVNTFNK